MNQSESICVAVRIRPNHINEEICVENYQNSIQITVPSLRSTNQTIKTPQILDSRRRSTSRITNRGNNQRNPNPKRASFQPNTPKPRFSNGGLKNKSLFEQQFSGSTNVSSLNQEQDTLTHNFTFDRVFDQNSKQKDVFQLIEPYIVSAVNGYNSTILAYGQTGSGKTYTMTGTEPEPGVIPKTIHKIFELTKSTETINYLVRTTFIEIYNNQIYDLLDPNNVGGKYRTVQGWEKIKLNKNRKKIKICEDPKTGKIFLVGSDTFYLGTATSDDCLSMIQKGEKRRAISSTNLNQTSSRSHTLLTLIIESYNKETGEAKVGKLNLVDLAGSESSKHSGASGTTLNEACKINSSLSALADVLTILSKKARLKSLAIKNNQSKTKKEIENNQNKTISVPYRNSKLTRLLKDSLGGNSRTVMITTVHRNKKNWRETLNSLRYSRKAKFIKNRISKNTRFNSKNQNVKKANHVSKQLQSTISDLEKLKKESQLDKQLIKEKSLQLNLLLESQQEYKRLNNLESKYNQKFKNIRTRHECEKLSQMYRNCDLKCQIVEEKWKNLIIKRKNLCKKPIPQINNPHSESQKFQISIDWDKILKIENLPKQFLNSNQNNQLLQELHQFREKVLNLTQNSKKNSGSNINDDDEDDDDYADNNNRKRKNTNQNQMRLFNQQNFDENQNTNLKNCKLKKKVKYNNKKKYILKSKN
ncbi:centromere protein e [Anaeramoeba flamelloides]|uniref:Kinesin-like protein n=1 Tax=Anaeramoeba flamelloides TaxID=1746091 RepID=A0ABQ8X1X7_9EUKA|nr:centromere protein e [Anaeramoeba flamelloides]